MTGTTIPLASRRWVEWFARAGYAAKGAVYLLIGLLATQAAAGAGGETTGTSGVLRVLLRQPFGRWLLGLVAIGLAGYALWRAFNAAFDPAHSGQRDWKRAAVRTGYAMSALIHAGIAWKAARLALGLGDDGGSERQPQHRSAQLLALPFGQWLLGAVALGVAGYGIAQIVKGVRGKDQLPVGGIPTDVRRTLARAAQIGLIARGVVFEVIALFFGRAAFQHDAGEAGGLAQALQELSRQPYAPVVLGGVAIGLAAYGAYQLALSRWAVVSTG